MDGVGNKIKQHAGLFMEHVNPSRSTVKLGQSFVFGVHFLMDVVGSSHCAVSSCKQLGINTTHAQHLTQWQISCRFGVLPVLWNSAYHTEAEMLTIALLLTREVEQSFNAHCVNS